MCTRGIVRIDIMVVRRWCTLYICSLNCRSCATKFVELTFNPNDAYHLRGIGVGSQGMFVMVKFTFISCSDGLRVIRRE